MTLLDAILACALAAVCLGVGLLLFALWLEEFVSRYGTHGGPPEERHRG